MLHCGERIKAPLCGPGSVLLTASSSFYYDSKITPMESPDFTDARAPEKAQNECSSEPESLLEKLEGREDPINWSHFSKCM